jgi:hypothetical protein
LGTIFACETLLCFVMVPIYHFNFLQNFLQLSWTAGSYGVLVSICLSIYSGSCSSITRRNFALALHSSKMGHSWRSSKFSF